MSHHNLLLCQSRDLCRPKPSDLKQPFAKHIPAKAASKIHQKERNNKNRNNINLDRNSSFDNRLPPFSFLLLRVLLYMAAVTLLTFLTPERSAVFTDAATVKFDWNKENKLFKSQNPHLVRLHIGDRLEITCAHKSSVIILTERFQDYFSCQNGSAPLWSYRCSKLFSEKYRFYRHKLQLPIYRYSSISKAPSFQFGHPYFLIDIGYLDTLPHSKLKQLESSDTKQDKNGGIRRSTSSADSNSSATSSKLTQPGQSSSSGNRDSSSYGKNRPDGIHSDNKSQHPYDPSSQSGVTWRNKPDADAMLMDSTNDEGQSQGQSAGQEKKSKKEITDYKERPHDDDEEEQDVVLLNACNQYHMKLPFFVEFRDDNIGGDHSHLPIEDEIKAVEDLFEKENHVPPNEVKYNYTYIFKLNPTGENVNEKDVYQNSRPSGAESPDSSSTTNYRPKSPPNIVEFTLMNDTHPYTMGGTHRPRDAPTHSNFPGGPGGSTAGGFPSSTRNQHHKVQSTKGASSASTSKGQSIDQNPLAGSGPNSAFGGDVSTHNFMMGDSSEISSHVTVEQYEMMRENSAASHGVKLTSLVGVNFYAVTTCLCFGAKWLF